MEGHGIQTAVLGFPRIGPDRELKQALESFWRDETTGHRARAASRPGYGGASLTPAAAAGIDVLPSNDFSLYDHVLDAALLVGASRTRFAGIAAGSLELLFAMARGPGEARPLEMTKWFDTNYHYLVPEICPDTEFALRADKPLVASSPSARGSRTRPVLLGPVSFLPLAKGAEPGARPLDGSSGCWLYMRSCWRRCPRRRHRGPDRRALPGHRPRRAAARRRGARLDRLAAAAPGSS